MSTESETSSDDPKVEVETVGVDEIVRQERVRSIFDARQACRDYRMKVKTEITTGGEQSASTLYRNALESYIREVEPLFFETEEGRDYWEKHDFGVLDLTPRAEDLDVSPEKFRKCTILEQPPEGRRVKIRGLRMLFKLSTPHRCQFEMSIPSKGLNRGDIVRVATVGRYMPVATLDEMFAVTNRYLAEIGFGVHVQQAQQNTKLDEGIMEEVEQWRAENL